MGKLRVFLTGGNGLVGRNLREHPSIGNHDLIAPGSAELDLRDFDAVSRYLRDCAGLTSSFMRQGGSEESRPTSANLSNFWSKIWTWAETSFSPPIWPGYANC